MNLIKTATFFLALVLLYPGLPHGKATAPALDKVTHGHQLFPCGLPHHILKIQDKVTGASIVRILYSRPQKKGRVLFGDLVQYGQVWRLGANEATEIEFFRDAKIDGKKVKKGRYTLYALVDTDKWTLILNKETDHLGPAFRYDSTKDLLRVTVPVQERAVLRRRKNMSMAFEKNKDSADLRHQLGRCKVPACPFIVIRAVPF